jgi:SNF2 family DNA or RNA helicase
MDVKPYQDESMRWIMERESQGRGGILALEMGLGKTLMMMSTMLSNVMSPSKGVLGGTLIVVPCNILNQWVTAIEKFVGVAPIVYYGYKSNKYNILDFTGDNGYMVITTYGTLNKPWKVKNGVVPDRSILTQIKWGRIVCDEAHHMREHKSGLFKNAMLLKGAIRWMLTGTPINNRVDDLISLLRMVGVRKETLVEFQEPSQRYEIITDNVFYKSKAGVCKLPKKTTETIRVISDNQMEINLLENTNEIFDSRRIGQDITINNVERIIRELFFDKTYFEMLVRSRQACTIPKYLTDLINVKYQGIDYQAMNDIQETHVSQSKIEAIVNKASSEKINKKIIFCHYRKEIDDIYDGIRRKNPKITVQKIDGRNSLKEKHFQLTGGPTKKEWFEIFMSKRFMNKHDIFIIPDLIRKFLTPDICILQINSCCEGLNLQQFNQVYFTSPHWNPAVEDQAIARIHRIGQMRPISVFKFISSSENLNCKYTIDEYCDIIQNVKRKIAYNHIVHPDMLLAEENATATSLK